jgi:predicted alpha/beta superfamily hydrolase
MLKTANRKNLTVNFQFFGNKNHASIAHEAIYKMFEWFRF